MTALPKIKKNNLGKKYIIVKGHKILIKTKITNEELSKIYRLLTKKLKPKNKASTSNVKNKNVKQRQVKPEAVVSTGGPASIITAASLLSKNDSTKHNSAFDPSYKMITNKHVDYSFPGRELAAYNDPLVLKSREERRPLTSMELKNVLKRYDLTYSIRKQEDDDPYIVTPDSLRRSNNRAQSFQDDVGQFAADPRNDDPLNIPIPSSSSSSSSSSSASSSGDQGRSSIPENESDQMHDLIDPVEIGPPSTVLRPKPEIDPDEALLTLPFNSLADLADKIGIDYGTRPVSQINSISNIDLKKNIIDQLKEKGLTYTAIMTGASEFNKVRANEINKKTKKLKENLDAREARTFEERDREYWNNLEKVFKGRGIKPDDKDGLYNDQIDQIMSKFRDYKGTIMRDEIKKILPFVQPQSRLAFIINTDTHDKPGQHWIASYIDARNGPESSNSLEWFDSFGRSISDLHANDILEDCKLILKCLKPETILKVKENKVIHQKNSSSNCGWFACKFLIDRFRGKSFSEATGFNDNQKINDSKQGEKQIEKIKNTAPFSYIST